MRQQVTPDGFPILLLDNSFRASARAKNLIHVPSQSRFRRKYDDVLLSAREFAALSLLLYNRGDCCGLRLLPGSSIGRATGC